VVSADERRRVGRMTPTYRTVAEWIARAAIPFAPAAPGRCDAAIDAVIAALGDGVELLGFGEALHGGEELLTLRNRLFQRLVERHGYSAIAIESSFPRSRAVNDYVAGHGPASYGAVEESGFSNGFGRLAANRELVEWMRRYNADPARRIDVRFYGFDMPGQALGPSSPRAELHFVLDYLAATAGPGYQAEGQRIDRLLGPDTRWVNPMDWRDPAQVTELLADANALRVATEDLLATLRIHRPALVARSDAARYREAVQYAQVAREHLNFFTVLAGEASFTGSLGVRDALMADTLAYIVDRERGRGKVLAFAHNAHLQRGAASMTVGTDTYRWWPAGAQLDEHFGARYAVIGSAVGVSAANGLEAPEAGTLEAQLMAAPGPARFIPTWRGQGLPVEAIAALPLRSGSRNNPSYSTPLNRQHLTAFDWLVAFDTVSYSRGGPPLQQRAAKYER